MIAGGHVVSAGLVVAEGHVVAGGHEGVGSRVVILFPTTYEHMQCEGVLYRNPLQTERENLTTNLKKKCTLKTYSSK